MIAHRCCAVVLGLGFVALAVVCIRVEQTRVVAESLSLERASVSLRRELWQLQSGVARLRTPARLQASVEWFDIDLASASSGGFEMSIRGGVQDPSVN